MFIESPKRLSLVGADVNELCATRLRELKERRDALNELISQAEQAVVCSRVDWGHFGSYTVAVERANEALHHMGAQVEGV